MPTGTSVGMLSVEKETLQGFPQATSSHSMQADVCMKRNCLLIDTEPISSQKQHQLLFLLFDLACKNKEET